LIHRFNLQDSVLIDHFTLEEMAGLYQLSELCFYPSAFGEPFGLTMLEAMAASKPMVITDSGGMPEVIKDGVNGFVIKVRDWEALAERALQLLEDEDLRLRMGITGRRMVEEFYHKERMADDILRVLEKVLA
jgi:glycosyltransferase involved in cell wall biosynthesis